MFDIFLDHIKKLLKSRLFPITLIYIALFAILINKLFVLQIVEGPTIAEKNELRNNKNREIKSTRGNIYDRNGKLLATNVLSYSVVMEDSTKIASNEQRNAIVHELIRIIEKNGDTLYNEFYITQNDKGELEFTLEGSDLTRFKKNVFTYVLDEKGQLSEEQMNATADEVYEFLRNGNGHPWARMFEINDNYTVEETLKIMSIRYALLLNYPKYNVITIATEVSDKTLAAVKESSAELLGVDVLPQTSRVYNEALYFAHIIGYTGLISAKELEKMETEGLDYNSTDVIGKSGLELYFEQDLRGAKGSELVTVGSTGKVIDVLERQDPVAGNDIYLTIDSDLQRSTYHILEKQITRILLMKIVPNLDYGSKGESAAEITIPIYEVYYALINNNIIDITALNAPDATELEKQTYQKYIDTRDEVFTTLDTLLSMNNEITNSNAGDMKDYLDYFYSVLQENIFLKDNIADNDETLKSYKDNKISLSRLLQHALANNWVDQSKLNVKDEFNTAQELYDKLIQYAKEILKKDDIFNKKIYRKLVFSYKLSGSEICLLLFDQGVLEYNEDSINNLKNGRISGYNFIKDKLTSLEITPAMLALEPSSGSLVVTDVVTGEVLAMVTYPSYDNNKFANKIDYEYYNMLRNDRTKPFNNRPLTQKVAPGSIFKMVTAFAALEEGITTPNEKILDLGIFDKVDPPAKCHRYPGTHGAVNLADALKVSCNYYFYEMGWRLSIDGTGKVDEQLGLSRLEKYATLFGLNEPSGIELFYEAQPEISVKDPVRSSIGQGSNDYTPLQLARYITTLANRGKNYQLTLLEKISDKDGKTLLENSAVIDHDLTDVSSSTWNSVFEGMYKVINEPGGSVYTLFKDLGVKVAGKTGTSQISKVNPNNALFVSFAPYENPEISVTAVIPNGYTSQNAAELTKDIYKLYFKLDDTENLVEGEVTVSETAIESAIE